MTVNDPFQLLGIKPTNDVDVVRRAYHLRAMRIHPDRIQDAELQQKAKEQMVALNQAYEQALRFAGAHKAPYQQSLTCEDAIRLAQKMLSQHSPESALRQLLRSESRSADWFYLQGLILMQMKQYEAAHQSFREAVKREPDNMTFRSGALDAAVAMKKAATFGGKLRSFFGK